jgi:hypothetical protein
LQLTLGKLLGGMGPENRLASLVAWSAQLSSSSSMASSQVAKGAPPDGVEREARSMKYKEERPLANLDAAVKKLLEIANGMEADHAGRLQVGAINAQFFGAGGNVHELWRQLRPRSIAATSPCTPVRTCLLRRRARICSHRRSHDSQNVAPLLSIAHA